ncbi:hypothetical protein ACFSJU_04025 [Paradesertivirga mongoliensis]|uniref:Uncharacterized protein n=1 Tax=Paradesertivirga mongoliensis TaxID=2100740 RepID=A0ABW4ZHQ5_9SPHI|nr:hypothetical protein [Pedobacter mongoliensis]
MKPLVLSIVSLALAFQYSSAQSTTEAIAADTSTTKSPASAINTVKSGEKKNAKNNIYVMRSQSYLNDVTKLEEGYTPLEGGKYAIKDYLVKGSLNLVCVTVGVALSSGNINSGETAKRYYLLRHGDNNSYREVFLTKKSGVVPGMSKVLIGTGQTYRGMLNTKKSTGSMVEVSKAILAEMMEDEPEIQEKMKGLEKITVATIKQLVKLYNSKHSL